jgi:hypothetical protein
MTPSTVQLVCDRTTDLVESLPTELRERIGIESETESDEANQ